MLSGNLTDKLIQVLITDDHPVVRGGLRTVLGTEAGIKVVGEAVDGLQAEQMAVELKPDIILMDVYMPNRGGLEAMLRIKPRLPEVKFLFLTVSEDEDDLFQAIRLGADGYLLKKTDIREVVNGIRRVMAGETILSSEMAGRVMKELRDGKSEPDLSSREREVLELISQGLTNSEIASRLFVSLGTVSTYVYRLLKKLQLKNRAEAIAYSIRHNKHERKI